MNQTVGLKIAASTLILGLTMVGCKPASYRPATASAATPTSAQGAAKAYAKSQEAIARRDFAAAQDHAERAVALSPRDIGYRMLLADLYLKNGRFVSAEAEFSDVLVLDRTNVRAGLNRALALIATGRTGEAVIALDALTSSAPAADVGLAFALAGQAERAIDMLEPAARAPEANGRVRQNLALAYAIAGDWQKARIVASQDLAPDEVEGRLEQWASMAQPSQPHQQVAGLLGVSAVEDGGRPVHLALAPAMDEGRAFAAADAPASAPAPLAAETAPQAPVEVAATEVPSTPEVAAPAPEVRTVSAEAADVFASPAAPTEATVAVPASNGRKTQSVEQPRFAAAVKSLVDSPAPARRASSNLAPAPVRAFQTAKFQGAVKAKRGGKFVVQLGAYRTAAQVEKAWAQAIRRYRITSGEPLSTTVSIPGKGTFHRLAVSGFDTPADAGRLCQSLRSKGGSCFVRPNAGDSPVRWASRYALPRG